MNQDRIHKLEALKKRLTVVQGHLPSYTEHEWAAVFEICAVLEAFIDMALRKEL